MLKTRIISAFFGLPIIIAILLLGGKLLYLFVFLLSLMGLYEYYKAFLHIDYKPITWIGYLITVIYYIQLSISKFNFVSFTVLIFIALLIIFWEIIKKGYNVLNVAITVLGIIYVPFLFSYLLFIYNSQFGKFFIWLPFLTAWLSDTGGYFIGSYFGRNKLCPDLSPKKTMEGAVGGIIASGLVTAIIGVIFNNAGIKLNVIHYLVLGLICGITSILGDLSASSIKRFTKLKDYGNIIPGHGGILDRFDSILFTAPTVFIYITIINKLI
ncbi:MAG TPA: CDP-archaeol synthase [Clostridiales bacterium]|nr:CDP-archaeol synthase [Clostridiales bacterium]